MKGKDGKPILEFKDAKAWAAWLKVHSGTSDGIWLRFRKKGAKTTSVNYDEALDEALCWGWIDSLVNALDADSYIQKFGPRRSRSLWSDRNRGIVARLIKERRMRPPGFAEIERAKKDGRWENAYASPANAKPPADFLKALAKDKKAKAFFATLNKTNTYAVIWRVTTAKKPETRARRIKTLVEMLGRGEKLY